MSLLGFFFDYSSPFAYLGQTQVERVAREHGATLAYRPFLLGGLFKAIGTPMVPLHTFSEAKQRYQRQDMYRWAEHWGVPLNFPKLFPMMTVTALRMTLQLDGAARAAFVAATFRAYWVDGRDINHRAELEKIAGEANCDGAKLLAGCDDPAVKAKLHAATEEARVLGVCGAPSFLVQRDEHERPGVLFWGQDRFGLIEKTLEGWRPIGG